MINNVTIEVSEEPPTEAYTLDECLECNRIQQQLQKIYGSLTRLGIYNPVLRLSKTDIEYMQRLFDSNPNWSGSKFYKKGDSGFVLSNIRVEY